VPLALRASTGCAFLSNCREMRVDESGDQAQPIGVGKTKRQHENVYVDHDKYAALLQLAKRTRIPRAVLWREALDDLLEKYGALQGNANQI
jgi:Ribbon-helix-helix domain